MLLDAANTLSKSAEPSSSSLETIRYPFGRHEEGFLDAKILLTGKVAVAGTYLSYHTPTPSITVRTILGDNRQWDEGATSTRDIAIWLDSVWPESRNNDQIRELSDENSPSTNSLVQAVARQLISSANDNIRIDTEFCNYDPEIYDLGSADSSEIDSSTVMVGDEIYRLGGTKYELRKTQIGSLLAKIAYTMTIPYVYDGANTEIVCTTSIKNPGEGELLCYFYSPLDGRRHTITPKNTPQFMDEMTASIEKMVADKTSISTQP